MGHSKEVFSQFSEEQSQDKSFFEETNSKMHSMKVEENKVHPVFAQIISGWTANLQHTKLNQNEKNNL